MRHELAGHSAAEQLEVKRELPISNELMSDVPGRNEL